MFTGPNAPHRPTTVMLIVIVLVLFLIYHVATHRGA